MIGKHNSYGLLLQGESFLTACVGRESGETPFRVHWFSTLPLEGLADSDPWRELHKQLKHTLLALPSENANLVQASMPSLKSDEVHAGLLGLVIKHKGGELGAWHLSHERRDDGEGKSDRYTGLAMELATMAPYVAPFDAIGQRPRQALPGVLVLDQLFREQIAGEEDPGAWNLVYIGKEEQQLVIGDAAGPRLLRSLPQDLSKGEEPEEYVERLSTEIERSNFFAQQGEASTRVQRILVCGDPALADPLVSRLTQVEGMVTERWRPEQLFAVDEGHASWDVLMPMAAAAVAMGSPKLNIMPVPAGQNPGSRFRRQVLGIAALVCLALLPLLGGGGHSTRRVQSRTLDSQVSHIGEARVLAEEAARSYLLDQSMLARQAQMESKNPRRLDFAALLRDLSARVPGDVRLINLKLEQDREGTFYMEVQGECVGQTAEKAQAEFLRLHESMGESILLTTRPEPSRLQITGGENGRATVSFTLLYELQEEVGG